MVAALYTEDHSMCRGVMPVLLFHVLLVTAVTQLLLLPWVVMKT
jgi:hypothetical protein